MAYNVSNDDIMSVTFEGYLYGQNVMTVMHYRLRGESGVIDGADALNQTKSIINTPGTGLYTEWLDCLSEDVTAIMQYYQWISSTRYAYLPFVPADRIGNCADQAGSGGVASVVTRRAELAGRSGVSNLHLPGYPLAEMIEGFVSNGHAIKMAAFGAKSIEVIPLTSGGELVPVAFHRENPAASKFLTTYIVQETLRTQRRRTVGLGS